MWFKKPQIPDREGYLRTASPNERRCVARESLGFYGALTVGAIYQFSEPRELGSISTYTKALRQCVLRHPQLSCSVADSDTKAPYYRACARVDLSLHVQILPQCDGRNGVQSVQDALLAMLDSLGPPSSSIPAWKITVVPFSQQRCFVGFSFAHSLGDGMSGMAFHHTFLGALQEPAVEQDLIWTPTDKKLDPPFDTSTNLPISWSFLLRPLLGSILPKRIASIFGFAATAPSGIWTGSKLFYNSEKHSTNIKILSIDAAGVKEALKICRTHQRGKLTGLLHQLIINALSESLARYEGLEKLGARTAVNMRGPVGRSNDDMGNFNTAITQIHALKKTKSAGSEVDDVVLEVDWTSVRAVTERLAAASKELRDQPLGLLRYVSDVRSWVLSQLGEGRDCSYEISNLVSFQPSCQTKRCSVTEMIFCQPADALGAPLNFNVVGVANGPLSIAVSWQPGALALTGDEGEDGDEHDFVEKVCQRIQSGFARLVSN